MQFSVFSFQCSVFSVLSPEGHDYWQSQFSSDLQFRRQRYKEFLIYANSFRSLGKDIGFLKGVKIAVLKISVLVNVS